MMPKLDTYLKAQSARNILVISFLLILMIASVDYLTGDELSFSIFYLLPAILSAWYVNHTYSYIVCVMSAIAWFFIDNISGDKYSHIAIPYWNAFMRFGFFIVVASLIRRLHQALKTLEVLAQQDGLTSMMNARTFKLVAERFFDLAMRHKRPLALGYIDLDGFKNINDSMGHNVGDQVLKAVSAVIRKRVRISDLSGRLGGDEFAILLPDTNVSGAQVFFTELRESLLNMAAKHHWPLGFSVGIATFNGPRVSVDEAIKYADTLMYEVKKSGKNNLLIKEYSVNSNSIE